MKITKIETAARKIAKKERDRSGIGPKNCRPRILQICKMDKLEIGRLYDKTGLDVNDLHSSFLYSEQQKNECEAAYEYHCYLDRRFNNGF